MTPVYAPWTAELTQSQYVLVSFFLTIGVFALLAGLIRTVLTRKEVGAKYRSAIAARLGVGSIALVSYLALVIFQRLGYTLEDGVFTPTVDAINAFAPRYAGWAISVPLMTIEVLAVCTLVGRPQRRTRAIALGGSFLMVFFGFLGAFVIDGGENRVALAASGAVSCGFYLAVNITLASAVRATLLSLTPQAALVLRNATVLLLGGWFLYPVIALIQVFGGGGAWAATMQIAFTVADVTVKIGFGTLIQRVAALRTIEDARLANDYRVASTAENASS